MKVTQIRISNILGIKRLEFKPGKITIISGKNGSGKTSVLESIKKALGGGHDATLLRKGATEGEIVLQLDDGKTIIKKVTQKKSDLSVEDVHGKKMRLGATYLKDVVDQVGINPISILNADPKDRIKMLLGSIPLKLPVGEIKLITGLDVSGDTRHPLQIVEEKRGYIFEERAEINKGLKNMETMVSEMRKTIPFADQDDVDWVSQVGRLRGELEETIHQKNTKIAQFGGSHQQTLDALKEEAQQCIDIIKEKLEASLENEKKNYSMLVEELDKTFSEITDPLKAQIAEADANSKNQEKISGAKAFVKQKKEELAEEQAAAEALTEQIRSLDQLKAELVENLPVKDLEIVDGNIHIGGIPFDTLNQAAKIRFVLMIAGLRKTELPLVCVDGLEALDDGVFKAFEEEAAKTDMQFFVTRVSEEGELTVNSQ